MAAAVIEKTTNVRDQSPVRYGGGEEIKSVIVGSLSLLRDQECAPEEMR